MGSINEEQDSRVLSECNRQVAVKRRERLNLSFSKLDHAMNRAAIRARYMRILVIFTILAAISTYWMLQYVGWSALAQPAGIILVAAIGESYVSSQGYYEYPKSHSNGPFIRNVPIWIPFLWIFSIQAAFLTGLIFGLSGFEACLWSGLLALVFDLLFLEPYFSRQKELWIWYSVRNGYFRFIPSQFDRFTAPPGNYLVWLIFPILMNYGTVLLSMIVP
ncbi:MAG: hypothetical protein ACFFER_08655 [Candidatus Thorarchaeota archaeon]